MLKNRRFLRISAKAISSFGSCLFLMTSLLSGHAYSISGQAIINLTNTVRAENGLSSLAWNSALSNSAWLKAQDMCQKGYWSHTAPDGSTAWTLIEQSGYAYLDAGENLAKGFSDDAAVVGGWMASSGHRANILKAGYADIGVATASCSFQGADTQIVVAHYGTRTAAKVASQKVSPPPAPVVQKEAPQAIPEEPQVIPEPTPVAIPEVKPAAKTEDKPNNSFWSLIWQSGLKIKLF